MIINMESRELSPDVSAFIFTGRFVRGNRLGEVEHPIHQRIQQGRKKMVLDLTGIDFIDSSGIGVLAVGIGVMEQLGGMVCAPGQVRQLMKITHLDQRVEIYPDLASAQSALSAPSATPPPA
jgi:anti-sigma B factor antagonist